MLRNISRAGTALACLTLLALVGCGGSGSASGPSSDNVATEEPGNASSSGSSSSGGASSLPDGVTLGQALPETTLNFELAGLRALAVPGDGTVQIWGNVTDHSFVGNCASQAALSSWAITTGDPHPMFVRRYDIDSMPYEFTAVGVLGGLQAVDPACRASDDIDPPKPDRLEATLMVRVQGVSAGQDVLDVDNVLALTNTRIKLRILGNGIQLENFTGDKKYIPNEIPDYVMDTTDRWHEYHLAVRLTKKSDDSYSGQIWVYVDGAFKFSWISDTVRTPTPWTDAVGRTYQAGDLVGGITPHAQVYSYLFFGNNSRANTVEYHSLFDDMVWTFDGALTPKQFGRGWCIDGICSEGYL